MKPLLAGRRLLYEYLVRKEPEIVLTVVCKCSVVPVRRGVLSISDCDFLVQPIKQADMVSSETS